MIPQLVLCLTLAATATATDSPASGAPDAGASDAGARIARIERAVVVGSVDALEQARAELQPRVAGDGALAEPRYLLAYVDWRLAQLMMAEPKKLAEERLEILEEAQRHLEVLLAAEPEHAEAHALLGSILGLQIGDSMFRGMRLGPRSSAAIDRAHELAPDNPRVALARSIGWFHTPKMFGGSVEKAAEELRRAEELFHGEGPDKAWPWWGRVDVLIWRGQVQARLGNPDAARAFYRQALAIEPDHGWIRYQLLPALDSGK